MGKVFVFLVKSNKGPFYPVRIKTFLDFMQYLSRFIYSYEHFLSFSSTYHVWEDLVVLRDQKKILIHVLSPLIRLAICMSLGIIVTLFAWMAHKFKSSNKPTK